MDEIGEHFRKIAEQEDKPLGRPIAYDSFHYEHQIPGGMLSNFHSQLAHAGLGHKFEELLAECARVRRELGYPIMITPFAQLVGTQAVFNVVQGERYGVVPDEIKKYALGYYGHLLAPIDPDVLDRIVANGSAKIALRPEPPPPAVTQLRKHYPRASDDERLLRFMITGNQVDEMLKAGPMRTEYHFEKPIIRLIRELANRPKLGRVYIRSGDLGVDIHKT